jgi:hypothetical protein
VHREIGDPLDAGKSGIQKDHIISENLDPQLSLGMTKYDPVSLGGGNSLPRTRYGGEWEVRDVKTINAWVLVHGQEGIRIEFELPLLCPGFVRMFQELH